MTPAYALRVRGSLRSLGEVETPRPPENPERNCWSGVHSKYAGRYFGQSRSISGPPTRHFETDVMLPCILKVIGPVQAGVHNLYWYLRNTRGTFANGRKPLLLKHRKRLLNGGGPLHRYQLRQCGYRRPCIYRHWLGELTARRSMISAAVLPGCYLWHYPCCPTVTGD
jgi:hypothetical protein